MTDDEPIANDPPESPEPPKTVLTPVRIFLRGLAVSLPAVLTIVILIWVVHGVNDNIIQPATWTVKYILSQFVDESVPSSSLSHLDSAPPLDHCGTDYLVTRSLRSDYINFRDQTSRTPLPAGTVEEPNEWNPRAQQRIDWMQDRASQVPSEVYVRLGPKAVPYSVYAEVARNEAPGQVPESARGVYMEYVALRYFNSVIPLSLITVFLIAILLYFLGRFVSIRVGRWIVMKFEEQVLGRLPVIRNVYGSVKQVTDFVLTENQHVEYRRVVAVEYPRKGIWTIGFLTGESMMEIAIDAGEPCVAVLIPTSPMPFTGFTISVPKSEVLDLNLTVEQAMQFCISCGVLTPSHQRLTRDAMKQLARRIEQNPSDQEVRAGTPNGSGNSGSVTAEGRNR